MPPIRMWPEPATPLCDAKIKEKQIVAAWTTDKQDGLHADADSAVVAWTEAGVVLQPEEHVPALNLPTYLVKELQLEIYIPKDDVLHNKDVARVKKGFNSATCAMRGDCSVCEKATPRFQYTIPGKTCLRAEQAGVPTVFAHFSHEITDMRIITTVLACLFCLRYGHRRCLFDGFAKLIYRTHPAPKVEMILEPGRDVEADTAARDRFFAAPALPIKPSEARRILEIESDVLLSSHARKTQALEVTQLRQDISTMQRTVERLATTREALVGENTTLHSRVHQLEKKVSEANARSEKDLKVRDMTIKALINTNEPSDHFEFPFILEEVVLRSEARRDRKRKRREEGGSDDEQSEIESESDSEDDEE